MEKLIHELQEIFNEADMRLDVTDCYHENYWFLKKQAELFLVMAKILKELKNENS